jgi:hypothetical protein
MRTYRILHQRADGVRPVLLFQNRIVEAENAEQALRLAMRTKAAQMQIDVRSEQLALATPVTANNALECWRAEFEPLATISA